MSDRLNESDLADVWRKLYVVHAKWVDMGLELGLKIHTLEGIRPKCSSDPCQCLLEVLKEWLRGVDPLPTWHAIIQALKSPTVGHHRLADCIQTELLPAVSTVPTNSPKTTEYQQENPNPGSYKCVALVQQSHRRICDKFTKLQQNVRTKLQSCVNVKQFYLFVTGLFPPGDCIPDSVGFDETFSAISKNGLWDYINYSSLKCIVKEFAGNDIQMSEWVKQYEEARSGYMLNTKISDHINVVATHASDSMDIEQSEGNPAKYDARYYRRLSVKVDAKVNEKPMQYINELWESLAFHFVLPSHTVILDSTSIHDDGILVTWLVPTGNTLDLVKNTHTDAEFFQEHSILWAKVNDDYLYELKEEGANSNENGENDNQTPPSVPGCGCGRCSIHQLCTVGCPRPDHTSQENIWNEERANSQVVLQQKRRADLQHETKEIMGEFASLVSYTCTSIKQRVNLHEVALFLNQLESLAHVTKSTPSLLEEVMDDIWKAETMEKLFRLLTKFWSWYNHFLLEKIIDRFGDSEDQERLKKFREKFTIYSKNRLVDLSSAGDSLKLGVGGGKGQVPLLLKVDKEWDAIPVSQLADIKRDIASILEVESHLLYLASVRQGCIVMTFLVSASLVGCVFPLSPSQKESLAFAKVKWLKCGSYSFTLEGDQSQATKPEIKQPVGFTSPVPKRTQWNAIQKAISSSSRRWKHPSQKASLTSDRLKWLRCGSYYQDTVCTLGEDPEPREPVELRMLMSDEWRRKLMQDRLSQHIARCPPGDNCEDRVCKYFSWFQRHYSQCVQRGCRSCPKYRHWMECHAKNCHYRNGCILPLCQELKMEKLRKLFRLHSQDASEALILHTPHTQDPTQSLSLITHPTHSQSTPPHTPNNYCNRLPSLTEDTTIRAGEISMVRQPSVDTYDNPDEGMFSRNTSISSTGSIKLHRKRAKCAKIVVRRPTSEDGNKLKPTQRGQETGDNAKLLLRDRSMSLVGILRSKRGSERDDVSNKSFHLSDNSSLADSGIGSSAGSMTSPGEDLPSLEEPPSKPTMEKQPSLQDGPATVEGPHSMSDSASTLVDSESMPSFYSSLADSNFGSSIDNMTIHWEDLPSLEEPPSQPTMEKQPGFQDDPATVEGPHSMSDSVSTLVGSESMPSFYSSSTTPTDVLQQFQTTQSSPSGKPIMTPVSPLPGPMSQAQMNEMMARIDTCLAQNKDRVPVIDNFGKFVQHPSSSIQKTEEQLEALYPFLPKGCIPDFDMDCIQACQLMVSKEFGNREQLYYQQTLAEPLPEDEEDIERSLSHRDSVKEYLQGQFYSHRVYREGEHWERLWKLGSGGPATCFGIADKYSNSLLVLKEEKPDVEILDEGYICLKLASLTINSHPNIVEYFGAAMVPSRPVTMQLFLELMPACLQNYIFKCGPLSMEKVHHYAYQLFDAVDFLHHKLKIVHCDIKPANLLINHNVQRLKVADFGCAELLEECHLGPCFRGNEKAGTLTYNPPEHYREKRCSFAFDIWQCGCSVLAMCTGKRPWRHLFMDCVDRSERARHMKHHCRQLIGQQYSGHMTPAFLSEGLQQVLFGCLHSDYKMRPSAQDCMYLLATSEADTPSEKEGVLEALGYSRNPQFLHSFQPDPNRLDVYLGTLHHATTIAGLDHVLQGGWLGWIPYHDEMNYRDACRTITSYLPVSQHFGPFSLNVCENQPQAIWRALNGYEAGAQFQRVAENTLVDRTKAIIVRPTTRR